MRRFVCFFLVLFFASSLSLPVFAQDAQFQGRVTDPQQAVVAGAEVRIFNRATGVERKVRTNSEGLYIAPFIQSGSYQIYVQAKGFSTVSSEPLTLTVGQSLVFDVQLKVGSAQEQVTVEGRSQILDTTDASVSTIIDRKFVENIPLNGRSFQDLIAMTPGVVTQTSQNGAAGNLGKYGDFSVNGQRTQSNYYTVDGVSANTNPGPGNGQATAGTGGGLPSATALGTTQSLISVDALQEFRVLSSTYSAEYGRSPGGQFSMVTRSGTGTYHGVAFDYLRNNYFDANDWFNDYLNKPIAPLRQNDFGGTLGGPVWFPRLHSSTQPTFFFVSYEGLRLTQPKAASIQYVPDASLRANAAAPLKPLINAFPVQNGVDYSTGIAQFIASYALPSRIDSTSVRIDHAFSPKLAIFFRLGDTPTSSQSRTLSAVTATEGNTMTYTLGATSNLSSRYSNEFHLGYSRSDASQQGSLDSFGGAQPIDMASALGINGMFHNALAAVLFASPTGAGILSLNNSFNKGRQWNAVDTFAITHRTHFIKMGLDYRTMRTSLVLYDPYVQGTYNSTGSSLSLLQMVQNNAASNLSVTRSIPGEPQFRQLSLFLQDEWSITPRLHLSAGLRWELNPAPTDANGNTPYTALGDINNPSSLYLVPKNTSLWRTTYYNFAPRLGISWQVRRQPGWETVVRGGGGVFFDTDNNNALQGYLDVGYRASGSYTNAPLPVTAAQLNISPSDIKPPYSAGVAVFPVHLQLPYALEWNVSIQQALGKLQAMTVSYVGSNGRRLAADQQENIAAYNPNFSYVYYYRTGLTSNYQSLQLQFQRSVSQGLHALASYTWSHSLDYGSQDISVPSTRGNSDFDVRHSFQGGMSYELPVPQKMGLVSIVFANWGVDARLMLRTGYPLTLGGNSIYNPATGVLYAAGVNYDRTKPVYLYGRQYIGGRAINGGINNTNNPAFTLPPGTSLGNAARNFVRGFGAGQVNLAARRQFHLSEKLSLQFRAEAFNATNHPNFGTITTLLTSPTFGQPTTMLNGTGATTVASQYQSGGSRSMQFALKLIF